MMRSRKRDALFLTSALLFGMALAVVPSLRVSHADDVSGKGKHKGTVGDRCTSHNDCETKLRCLPSGDHKECADPPVRVFPT